jgi:hypothetical protein
MTEESDRNGQACGIKAWLCSALPKQKNVLLQEEHIMEAALEAAEQMEQRRHELRQSLALEAEQAHTKRD